MSNTAKIEFDELPPLVQKLWNDERSGPLTNQAAREIEKLSKQLQEAIDQRNEAWFKLEEAGIQIN